MVGEFWGRGKTSFTNEDNTFAIGESGKDRLTKLAYAKKARATPEKSPGASNAA
jgi:hypothetical protein